MDINEWLLRPHVSGVPQKVSAANVIARRPCVPACRQATSLFCMPRVTWRPGASH